MFGWLPEDRIKLTFDNATQFCRMPLGTNLKAACKSPCPACNVHRRDEPVATDQVCSEVPAVDSGGITIAQIFVGMKSLVSDVHGIKNEKHFVNTLNDVMRERGAPTKLISDSAQVETSAKVKDILRHLFTQDWQSEPHQQNQNFCERHCQDMKRTSNKLMDRTGSPPETWLLALKHASHLLNHMSNASLDSKTPLQVLTGVPPDVSALLRFRWYERVFYPVDESSCPSNSEEKRGRFAGFATDVGHSLTFLMLTDDTKKVTPRSVVRSGDDGANSNLRTDEWGDDGAVHESKAKELAEDEENP